MALETKAERLSRLIDDVVVELGNGVLDEGKIRQIRFLWKTTPDREKDGLTVTLKDLEPLIKDLRRELTPGAGKVKRIPIEYGSANDDC